MHHQPKRIFLNRLFSPIYTVLQKNFNIIAFLPSIRPFLTSLSMLQIMFPHTCVCCTIFMNVSPLTMCFIVLPLSFINFAIWVYESTPAMSISLIKVPFIFWSILKIWINLNTSHMRIPFPCLKSLIHSPKYVAPFSSFIGALRTF